jgi:hypothetical protein
VVVIRREHEKENHVIQALSSIKSDEGLSNINKGWFLPRRKHKNSNYEAHAAIGLQENCCLFYKSFEIL